MNDIVGAAEAAKIAGKSVETIKRLARTGQLPHVVKLEGTTGAWLFNRADVEALVAERGAA